MSVCTQCPRRCGVDRARGEYGACSSPDHIRIARAALHLWEEPAVSGTRGSGTIFFSGCNLHCVYCQNKEVSHGGKGRDITPEQLGEKMLELQSQGAHNINLVTPTHYAAQIIRVLSAVKKKLYIPVIYNTSGYERPETIDKLDGLVDIYMPDLKYYSATLSRDYSGAADYFTVARTAILKMQQQVGKPELDDNGMLRRGVLVRHLVLPGCRKDSIELMRQLGRMFEPGDVLLSLMSQYTPEFAQGCVFENLHRRVTTLEYETVLNEAMKLNFEGFYQNRSSATPSFTPIFEGEMHPTTQKTTNS
jgi:putative pyruvate formate lyase activating enzyme